jgi:hypothetical protein
MLRLPLAMLAALTLSACPLGELGQMVLSFSAYQGRPVVLSEMVVNGTDMAMIQPPKARTTRTPATCFGPAPPAHQMPIRITPQHPESCPR